LMVFENGPEYNMTSLDDDLYNELVSTSTQPDFHPPLFFS
jgi:hypothetical protein